MEFAYSVAMYAPEFRRPPPRASASATLTTTPDPTLPTPTPTPTPRPPTATDETASAAAGSYSHSHHDSTGNNGEITNAVTGTGTDADKPSHSHVDWHSAKRFRRPGRRRATSVHTQGSSELALKSSHHQRTPSSGANSRTSHESHPQKPLRLPFKPHNSSSKTEETTTENHVADVTAYRTGTTAPFTYGSVVASPQVQASAKTIDSTAPVALVHVAATPIASVPDSATSASASASASAPEPSPATPKPLGVRPAHLPFFHYNSSGHSHSQQNRLHKRDPYRRTSSHALRQASSDPSTPTLSKPGAAGTDPSWPRPLRPTTSRDQHDDMAGSIPPPKYPSFSRTSDSVSSASGTPRSNQAGVMASYDNLPNSSAEGSGPASTASASTASKPQSVGPKPFIVRNNRTYIHDPTLPYPLPVDLAELHRQSLRTLMTFQLFGGPIISTAFANKPPTRVLEVGCGSAFWSMMCHRYFAQHGHSSISFTGVDIVSLAGSGLDTNSKPDKDMKWRFVQHDLRRCPCPFPDGEFDLIMVKDLSLCCSFRDAQPVLEDYLRMLKPGGVIEVWETDFSIRMLRPHVLKTSAPAVKSDDSDSSSDEEDEEADALKLGAYVMTTNTPLSAPLNPFLVEYNGWITKALDARGLSAVPCTLTGPHLLQESETLLDVRSERLAVPLSEVRWEREGVGGVVTKDGKSYIDSMKGKSKATDVKGGKPAGKTLTAGQAALRRTALETTVGQICSLEPMLREVSGKSQDEWDGWTAKMVNDLLRENGTSWGECLEVGAWTARKRMSNKP
ncbi:Uu.00g095270.m01.CDS01 [Anthostomella pinea]|uniref:Uu.00g095270.m01.CDS01 n=1 Tax=Anthostomella pinea TaxID=933095 RepID=A0AAI8VU97_9PEZI|nr:Uu.00g095270.m01.CDS01 [Anthostomella pinea]